MLVKQTRYATRHFTEQLLKVIAVLYLAPIGLGCCAGRIDILGGESAEAVDAKPAPQVMRHGESQKDYTMAESFYRQIPSGTPFSEVLALLGEPQAYLRKSGDRFIAYFGHRPRNSEYGPLLLGPIEISYSQYRIAMGKCYREKRAPRLRETPNPEPDRYSEIPPSLAEVYALVRVGMHREEVESILGAPQAYDRLLSWPIAPGPSIVHNIAYYGPHWDGSTARPPVCLGPYIVRLLPEDHSVRRPHYRSAVSGASVQAWLTEIGGTATIPVEESWRRRYERLYRGMARRDVWAILGRPTTPLSDGLFEDRGPRLSWQDKSYCGLDHKIGLVFSAAEDGVLKRMSYSYDRWGYESDPKSCAPCGVRKRER